MSSAVISLPAFLKRNRPLDGEVLGSKAPAIPPDKDLEVLAQTIDILRNRKVIADGDFMKAEIRAAEAKQELNEAIDAYEAEVRERGILCRK